MFTEEMQIENAGGKFFSGAVIAISVVILQDLISSRITDTAIFISTIALAVEIPLLASCLTISFHESMYSRRAKKAHTYAYNTMYGFGLFCGFVGICSAMWHISWIVGTVFLICSILAFSISTSHHNEISSVHKAEKDYDKKIKDKRIGLKLLLQEQELRISIDPMGKTTTQELAFILKRMSQAMEKEDDITLDEYYKRVEQIANKSSDEK